MNIKVIDKRPRYASNQEVELLIDSTTISIYGGTTHHAQKNAYWTKPKQQKY